MAAHGRDELHTLRLGLEAGLTVLVLAPELYLPFRRLGVPTQISDRSVSRTASAVLAVARSRPLARFSWMSSSSPFSTIGLRPSLRLATLSGLTSTPTTV